MTSQPQDPGDSALDAMLETIARVDAPGGFTSRVSAALDADSQPRGVWHAWRVPVLATSAAALALLLAALWLTPRSHTPPTPTASQTTGSAQPAPALVVPRPRPEMANASAPPNEGHASATTPVRPRRQAPRSQDHERALPPLQDVAPLAQPGIDPSSLDVASIDVAPIPSIPPLTLESGRDTGGRGDFR